MTRTDLVESGAGWYVLVWSGEAGLDAWLESNADRVGAPPEGGVRQLLRSPAAVH